MTIGTIEHILAEAAALGTIEWTYFEGGEAFLYYQILHSSIRKLSVANYYSSRNRQVIQASAVTLPAVGI